MNKWNEMSDISGVDDRMKWSEMSEVRWSEVNQESEMKWDESSESVNEMNRMMRQIMEWK